MSVDWTEFLASFLLSSLILFFFYSNDSFTKLLLYTLCLFSISIVGCTLEMDILFIILLLCELLIVAVFLALILQIPLHSQPSIDESANFILNFVFNIVFQFVFFFSESLFLDIEFNDVFIYSTSLNNSDFFIFYYYYFEVFGFVTFCLVILLFLFSFFFILLFQHLKAIKYRKTCSVKLIQLIQKQQLTRQGCYKSGTKVFKTIN